MLKNSLYLNHFFPVYLFSGQKGCGKTSTARVFAAAINCEKLGEFQKNPRQTFVPCLECASCKAMQHGKHPDFIEIDAASNTGVDNVRNIIDAASLLPLMGRKKIYLIDEAHMLSKAAFNAFLKLMEEPPTSVLFMLATTDTQKIIDTVRSRCFQLVFKPIEQQALVEHISMICTKEDISYDLTGLVRIVQETGGCVRDALNLLEQVRFSHAVVTDDAVVQVLGYLDDAHIIDLYEIALQGKPDQLVKLMHDLHLEQFSADYIWKRFILLVRSLIWIKSGVSSPHFSNYFERLQNIAQAHSWRTLQEMSQLFFEQEMVFLKTSAQHAFLEMFLMRIAQRSFENCTTLSVMSQSEISLQHQESIQKPKVASPAPKQIENAPIKAAEMMPAQITSPWQAFLADIAQLQDPLVNSIFMQGSCVSFDQETGIVKVEFSKELVFFKDWLDNTNQLWQPLLKKHFAAHAVLLPEFSGSGVATPSVRNSPENDKKKMNNAESSVKAVAVHTRQTTAAHHPQRTMQRAQGATQQAVQDKNSLDISDTQKWKKTHMLLRYFPGIVREIHES